MTNMFRCMQITNHIPLKYPLGPCYNDCRAVLVALNIYCINCRFVIEKRKGGGLPKMGHISYWLCLLRKSKDYVYGIWVYKALGIWKGYYRVKKSLVSYVKPWTEARNNKYMKYHSKLTYQLSFWNVSRKVDYHAGGKWFIHGPKRRKENQLLSLKHPCWLSLV